MLRKCASQKLIVPISRFQLQRNLERVAGAGPSANQSLIPQSGGGIESEADRCNDVCGLLLYNDQLVGVDLHSPFFACPIQLPDEVTKSMAPAVDEELTAAGPARDNDGDQAPPRLGQVVERMLTDSRWGAYSISAVNGVAISMPTSLARYVEVSSSVQGGADAPANATACAGGGGIHLRVRDSVVAALREALAQAAPAEEMVSVVVELDHYIMSGPPTGHSGCGNGVPLAADVGPSAVLDGLQQHRTRCDVNELGRDAASQGQQQAPASLEDAGVPATEAPDQVLSIVGKVGEHEWRTTFSNGSNIDSQTTDCSPSKLTVCGASKKSLTFRRDPAAREQWGLEVGPQTHQLHSIVGLADGEAAEAVLAWVHSSKPTILAFNGVRSGDVDQQTLHKMLSGDRPVLTLTFEEKVPVRIRSALQKCSTTGLPSEQNSQYSGSRAAAPPSTVAEAAPASPESPPSQARAEVAEAAVPNSIIARCLVLQANSSAWTYKHIAQAFYVLNWCRTNAPHLLREKAHDGVAGSGAMVVPTKWWRSTLSAISRDRMDWDSVAPVPEHIQQFFEACISKVLVSEEMQSQQRAVERPAEATSTTLTEDGVASASDIAPVPNAVAEPLPRLDAAPKQQLDRKKKTKTKNSARKSQKFRATVPAGNAGGDIEAGLDPAATTPSRARGSLPRVAAILKTLSRNSVFSQEDKMITSMLRRGGKSAVAGAATLKDDGGTDHVRCTLAHKNVLVLRRLGAVHWPISVDAAGGLCLDMAKVKCVSNVIADALRDALSITSDVDGRPQIVAVNGASLDELSQALGAESAASVFNSSVVAEPSLHELRLILGRPLLLDSRAAVATAGRAGAALRGTVSTLHAIDPVPRALVRTFAPAFNQKLAVARVKHMLPRDAVPDVSIVSAFIIRLWRMEAAPAGRSSGGSDCKKTQGGAAARSRRRPAWRVSTIGPLCSLTGTVALGSSVALTRASFPFEIQQLFLPANRQKQSRDAVVPRSIIERAVRRLHRLHALRGPKGAVVGAAGHRASLSVASAVELAAHAEMFDVEGRLFLAAVNAAPTSFDSATLGKIMTAHGDSDSLELLAVVVGPSQRARKPRATATAAAATAAAAPVPPVARSGERLVREMGEPPMAADSCDAATAVAPSSTVGDAEKLPEDIFAAEMKEIAEAVESNSHTEYTGVADDAATAESGKVPHAPLEAAEAADAEELDAADSPERHPGSPITASVSGATVTFSRPNTETPFKLVFDSELRLRGLRCAFSPVTGELLVPPTSTLAKVAQYVERHQPRVVAINHKFISAVREIAPLVVNVVSVTVTLDAPLVL